MRGIGSMNKRNRRSISVRREKSSCGVGSREFLWVSPHGRHLRVGSWCRGSLLAADDPMPKGSRSGISPKTTTIMKTANIHPIKVGTNNREAFARASIGLSRSIIATTGFALIMGLSSCYFPHESQHGRNSTYTPYQSGYRFQTLPAGYRSETLSGTRYYYDNGNYYRRDSRGYVIVDAPRGSRYNEDYRAVRQGREVNSRRNQRIYDRNNPEVRYGEVITRLPSRHRVVNHRGQRYYQSGDHYYTRDQRGYTLVRNPY